MSRTHDVTISAFDLEKLEKELQHKDMLLKEAYLNLRIIRNWAKQEDLVPNLVLTACERGMGND